MCCCDLNPVSLKGRSFLNFSLPYSTGWSLLSRTSAPSTATQHTSTETVRASIFAGAAAWKDRPGHFLVFILFWSTVVYDQVARWTWSTDGWISRLGSLDFAGGGPIHIATGGSVLAHSIFHKTILPFMETLLRPRTAEEAEHARAGIIDSFTTPPPDTPSSGSSSTLLSPGRQATTEPRDIEQGDSSSADSETPTSHTNMLLGTMVLWAGWFGLNGGFALAGNMQAVSACLSTHLAACSGGVTLCVARAFKRAAAGAGGKIAFSVADFCNGVIVGLIAMTAGAGYVSPSFAPLFGVATVLVCWPLAAISEWVDDSQYIFTMHGVGGLAGVMMTGVFATGEAAALDGVSSPEKDLGGLDGNWGQLA
jgi:ammonium transporter, Amt family